MAKTTQRPNNPHFCKPILGAPQQEISIPKAFLRCYLGGEKCEGKATLITRRSGEYYSWTVSIKRGCFKDGWEDFARAHNLNYKDLLVFKHVGDLKFHVLVFDPTACERDYPPLNVPAKIEQKTEIATAAEKKKKKKKKKIVEENPPQFKVTMQPSCFKWSCLNVPAKFGRENGLEYRFCKITLKDPKGKSWEVMLRSKQSSGLAYFLGGWREFSAANELKLGDVCTFKLVSNGSKKIVMQVSISRSKFLD